MPYVLKDEKNIKVAAVSFAYDNKGLLSLLAQRGTLITAGKYTKLREVNDKIKHYVTTNEKTMNRPVCAFVTFET